MPRGVEKEYVFYNFIGQPLKRKHIHSATDKATQTEVYAYSYDQVGQLLTTTHQLNDNAQTTLISNTYDEVGCLISNQRNGTVALKTDYTWGSG